MVMNLSQNEKGTFRLHMTYSFFEGIITGILALNEFVLIKSLHGSNYQIGFLFQFQVIVLLFSIFFNEFLRQTVRKKRLIKVVGILTHLPLLLFFIFPKDTEIENFPIIFHYLFLSIFLVYYMARPIIYPTINLFLKNTYTHQNFGKLYGYATTLNKIIILVSTFLFGLVLDFDHTAFRYVYPGMAVIGIISLILLSQIRFKEAEDTEIKKQKYIDSIKGSYRRMVHIIKTNIPYRDFEIGFMFYGFAWMSTSAVITIFFEKALDLNYSSIAFYKNSYNILAIILLPYFSRLIGSIDPRKFAVITFMALLLFIFFMGLTEYFQGNTEIFGIKIYYSLIASYFFYGIFAATMALLWFIGSAYFCKKEKAGDYQSVHLTLTGARGVFAPLIGVFFYELIGFTGTFALAIFSLFLGIILMFYSIHFRKDVNQYIS
jgi:Major Facilitator Superfamily